jgi:histidinol phosphatase-like enzyme (inositol monophosphatase family)
MAVMEARTDPSAARLEHALAVARAGGEHALALFRAPLDALAVERKPDGTPVTIADRGAERAMRAAIAAAFPDDAIEGEEEAARPGSSGFTWILDPIDGTRAFTRGVPLWGTLVAVEHADAPGAPVLGVIHCPAARETVWAGRGLGAFHAWDGGAPRPARVSRTPLAEGLVSTTSARHLARHTSTAALERVLFAAKSVRGWSDCYQHLLVATGRIEAAIDPGTEVWDNAALLPIVEEAGGRFTTLGGERTARGGSAVTSNGVVHEELLELLRG